ncbi:metalloendopeptidase [Collariella sp. IMI 366227]|nr:metalloendopeptidase [Collariella sp. IMI 366227]
MFKLLPRAPSRLSPGSSVLLRAHPATPIRAAARTISYRRLPHTNPPRCAAQPLAQPSSLLSPRTQQPHQTRSYNHPPPPNHRRRPNHRVIDLEPSPLPLHLHPSPHATRLATAKPLLHWRGWRALNTPSTYTVVLVAVSGALIFYFSNLETVPVSGRTRFNVYSPESVRKAGEMEYKRLMWELDSKGVRILPGWDPRTEQEWEVYVVDEPRVVNAFVLPGEVLGHEIAHNLADHHGERLSQDVGASIVLYSLVILGGVFGLGPLIMHFFGSRFLDVAFGFPMSRLQESEADYIGLMMMAEACYDPAEAVSFWARMEKATAQEQDVPEWMSTHPTNMNRVKKIQEWLPQAMEKRAQSDCSSTTAFADLFRNALRTGQIIMI